jgi:hypothetical protein
VYLYFHEYNYWSLNGSRKIKCVSGFEFQLTFRSFHPNPILQESFSLAIRVFEQKLYLINFILNLGKIIKYFRWMCISRAQGATRLRDI